MKIRKGIAAIVLYRENRVPKFLLLKRSLHWKGWEFIKGGIRKGESEREALKERFSKR